MEYIGVVDCNNFFVSCERLFRPDLTQVPVAVLSSNDGCIVARSQEVKDMGIPMGVPYFKVKDIIKDNKVVLFSSHFALYRDISRRVISVLQEELDTVEQYSVDEAFFTLKTDPAHIEPIARRVTSIVEQSVGVPVSIGVSSSKTKAKFAVEIAKKTTGVCILDPSEWDQKMDTIPLSALWGVGQRTFMAYQKAGYSTVADVLAADTRRIKALFGVQGERLQLELGSGRAYSVDANRSEQKSMMSSRSFKKAIDTYAVLEDAIAYHTRHIATDLRQKKLRAEVLRITIQASRYSDFLLEGATVEAVLPEPTDDTFALLDVAQNLLKKAYKKGVPYQKVGVLVGQLVSAEVHQSTLFTSETSNHQELLALVDQLNLKADRELITMGERRRSADWQSRTDRLSPAYTTKWTDVAAVRA